MITIVPRGGLCNRMRAMGSAIALADQINTPLHVIWELKSDLNCSFTELFKPPDKVTLTEVIRRDYLPSVIKRPINIARTIYNHLKYQRIITDRQIINLRDRHYDFTELGNYDSVLINTCHRFFPFDDWNKIFQPTDDINQIVESYAVNFSENTIGVHIRRADSLKSIEYSPTELFIEAMNALVEQNENTQFFLATNSPQDQQRLTELFPSRIITHPKKMDRNTAPAVQNALVDLMCLSKTKQILGSYWSSFSETAAKFHGAKLRIIRTKEDSP